MNPLAGFAPVADSRTRVLVMGSFPGVASLSAGEYYAHPQNLCWRLLGAVTGRELASLPYAERCAALLETGIGLWDVYGECVRQGSLDSAIRQAATNDFAGLRKVAPNLLRIGHNGRASARFAPLLEALGYETCVLPSSSPAYAAMRYDAKLVAWRAALAAREFA